MSWYSTDFCGSKRDTLGLSIKERNIPVSGYIRMYVCMYVCMCVYRMRYVETTIRDFKWFVSSRGTVDLPPAHRTNILGWRMHNIVMIIQV